MYRSSLPLLLFDIHRRLTSRHPENGFHRPFSSSLFFAVLYVLAEAPWTQYLITTTHCAVPFFAMGAKKGISGTDGG